MKDTKGKLEYRLIPPASLKKIAEVLKFGSEKYSAFNWTTVDALEFLDATYRHLAEARLGNLRDNESGLLHLAHAGSNILFMLEKQIEAGDHNVISIDNEIKEWSKEIDLS